MDEDFINRSLLASLDEDPSLSFTNIPNTTRHRHLFPQQQWPPVHISSQTPYGPHIQTASLINHHNHPQQQQQEDISTIFVVGFPDDMQEREFQNMFTFCQDFEAATLKIPNKEYTSYNGPPSSARAFGPNDPYNLVTANQGGVLVDAGREGTFVSWQSQSSLDDQQQPQQSNHFAPPSLNGIPPNAPQSLPQRKQIIGFAKFRTRDAALAARDALQGKRVDIEKGAVLKAEMAKKNLHTKRGVGLAGPAATNPSNQQSVSNSIGMPNTSALPQGLLNGGSSAPTSLNPGQVNNVLLADPYALDQAQALAQQNIGVWGARDRERELREREVRERVYDERDQLAGLGLRTWREQAQQSMQPAVAQESYPSSQLAVERERERSDDVIGAMGLSNGVNGRAEEEWEWDRRRQTNLRMNGASGHISHSGAIFGSSSEGGASTSDASNSSASGSNQNHDLLSPPSGSNALLSTSPSGAAGSITTDRGAGDVNLKGGVSPSLSQASTNPSAAISADEGVDPNPLIHERQPQQIGPWDHLSNEVPHRPLSASSQSQTPSQAAPPHGIPGFSAYGAQALYSPSAEMYSPQHAGGGGTYFAWDEMIAAQNQQQQYQSHSRLQRRQRTAASQSQSESESRASSVASGSGILGGRSRGGSEAELEGLGHEGGVGALSLSRALGSLDLSSSGVVGQAPSSAHIHGQNSVTPSQSQQYQGDTSPQLPSPASGSGASSGSGSGSGSYMASVSVLNGGGVNLPRNGVDQNPPINTLYVGNLPTSPPPHGVSPDVLEDALRELFSSRPGFRRLSFKQKQSGPMCFVEFEDVNHAARTLNDLYGNNLKGLVKGGGIRLSYSKNPLGVRTPTSANSAGPTMQIQQQQQQQQFMHHHHSPWEDHHASSHRYRRVDPLQSPPPTHAHAQVQGGVQTPLQGGNFLASAPPPRFISTSSSSSSVPFIGPSPVTASGTFIPRSSLYNGYQLGNLSLNLDSLNGGGSIPSLPSPGSTSSANFAPFGMPSSPTQGMTRAMNMSMLPDHQMQMQAEDLQQLHHHQQLLLQVQGQSGDPGTIPSNEFHQQNHLFALHPQVISPSAE